MVWRAGRQVMLETNLDACLIHILDKVREYIGALMLYSLYQGLGEHREEQKDKGYK